MYSLVTTIYASERGDLYKANALLVKANHTPDCTRDSQDISVFPCHSQVDLHFQMQHYLLSAVQSILEDACFSFAKRDLPQLLHTCQWNCSEAVELNVWAAQLQKQPTVLRILKDNGSHDRSLEELFTSVVQVRHIAVHRKPLTVEIVQVLLTQAASFASNLGDRGASEAIQKLWTVFKSLVEDVECIQTRLDKELSEKVKRLAAKREKIDRAERDAVSMRRRVIQKHQARAEKYLRQVIKDTDKIHFAPGSGTNYGADFRCDETQDITGILCSTVKQLLFWTLWILGTAFG